MIRRTQWGDALLALAAAWAAIYPIHTLFTSGAWGRSALGLSMIVVATGIVARAFMRRWWAVALTQLAVGLEAFILVHARGHHWNGLPTKDTVLAVNYLLYDARMALTRFSAPVPTDRGLIVGISLVVVLFVLVVDVLAVTRRSPAAAGLALLAGYLVTAVNSGEALPWYYFALPAGLWLVMIARTATGGMRRWATLVPGPATGESRGSPPGDGFAAMARVLGVAALAAAVLIPTVVPHLPTRFLIAGLGRTDSGSGGGSFSLSTTLELEDSLLSQSNAPVLTYRGTPPGPLRVAVVERYEDGDFYQGTRTADLVGRGESLSAIDPTNPPSALVGSAIDRLEDRPTEGLMTVEGSRLKSPQIALPIGALALTPTNLDASIQDFGDGTVEVRGAVRDYVVNFTTLAPSPEILAESDASDGQSGSFQDTTITDATRAVPQDLTDRLQATLAEIGVSPETGDLEAAVAIQEWLRGPDFTYDLELIGGGENGEMLDEPIANFLESKQGYCQQFAGAMALLARQHGIPARVGLGFLPGRRAADQPPSSQTFEVIASDAHAWPELFFEPFGWLRFEPTPGSRTGAGPTYVELPDGEDTPTESSTTASNSTTTAPQRPDVTEINPQDYTSTNPSLWRRIQNAPRWSWVLVALGFGLLGAAAVPAAALLARRRRLAAAQDDADIVEARWQDLIARISDLGIATEGTLTPRQVHGHLSDRGALGPEERAALGRVVQTLERARYAAPGAALVDTRKDVARVYDAIDASRSPGLRVRARLVPSAGTAAWGRLGRRVTGLPRRLLAEVRMPRRQSR